MKKIILILLMVLMPLQASWAAAAAYCQHENEVDVYHFGHHDHKLEHGHAPAGDDGDESGTSLSSDCIDCHGVCAGIVLSAPGMRFMAAESEAAIIASSYLPSASSSRPERPKWAIAA